MTATSTLEDLEGLSGYNNEERFIASRYHQGGRTVYSMDLSLAQIVTLIAPPNPSVPAEGNRRVREAHARAFGEYVRGQEDWISPPLQLRAPNIFRFDRKMNTSQMEFGVLSVQRLMKSDLRILDGQHRVLGIHDAMARISAELEHYQAMLADAQAAGESEEVIAHVEAEIKQRHDARERFARERIGVQVFVEDNPSAYKQMFYDIADNALGITASVRARFDARKIINRSLATVTDHPLLRDRVDVEQDRIAGQNPNLMSVKHVAELIRVVSVGMDGKIGQKQEDEFHEDDLSRKARAFLDVLVKAFPDLRAVQKGQKTPEELRRESLLGSSSMIKILAGVYFLLSADEWDDKQIAGYLGTLAGKMKAPVTKGSIWIKQGGDVFSIGAYAPRARRQDLRRVVSMLYDRARKPHDDEEPTPIRRVETLECEEGHSWERPYTPGRKPARCPEHRLVAAA